MAAGLWRGVVWCVMTVLVTPVAWLWRVVLVPVGRETAAAFGHAWRIAGYISRAVGRALKWLGWNLIGRPVRWVWLCVCTPVGHRVRDSVWAPVKRAGLEAGRAARGALRSARETVRQARRDAWRALVGGPADTWPSEREALRPGAVERGEGPGAAPGKPGLGRCLGPVEPRPLSGAGAGAAQAVSGRAPVVDHPLPAYGLRPGPAAEAVEPVRAPARTLGSKTTAPSAAPASSEISLPGGNTARQG
ncbi:hypothetical protein [Streptomyces sp. ISL-100]|uniref:hypothetical protein n=1 Tax=Streptomyces sp. ISL-100 TaxID=2819173 RepID=UPI001BEA7AFA|nr:hypothetical protein [Streptomyces sp. ISL-100]MBT2401596.1 hypothetical protein [Streptomyces sp. ISL-100]